MRGDDRQCDGFFATRKEGYYLHPNMSIIITNILLKIFNILNNKIVTKGIYSYLTITLWGKTIQNLQQNMENHCLPYTKTSQRALLYFKGQSQSSSVDN